MVNARIFFIFIFSSALNYTALAKSENKVDFDKIAQNKAAQLHIKIDNKEKVFSLNELQKWTNVTDFDVPKHPAYDNSPVKYKGVFLKDILYQLERKIDFSKYQMVITCLDGYRPVLDAQFLAEHKAFLAFKEVHSQRPQKASADGLWTLIKLGERWENPGPYYLVWDTIKTYPQGWSFQISEIVLLPKKEAQSLVLEEPKNTHDPEVLAGYKTFSENCFVCHSLHLKGPHGKAPDLTYMTGYRDDDYIKNTLKNGRGIMPPFTSVLTPHQIDQIIAFLKYTAKEVY